MGATAKLRFFRQSPRKIRVVAAMIRGKAVEEALQILRFQPKKAARALSKVLMSAVANATTDRKVAAEDLVVTKVAVDGGPTHKRWMPRSMGRSSRILRRTSHITLSVGEQ